MAGITILDGLVGTPGSVSPQGSKDGGESLLYFVRAVQRIWLRVLPFLICLGRLCCRVISPPARFLLSKLDKDEKVLASILESSKEYRDSPEFLPYYYCCRLLLLSEWQAARLLPKLLHAELEWVGGASPSQRASAILRAALDKDFVSTFATLIAKERGEEVRTLPKVGAEVEDAQSEREFLMALMDEELPTSWVNLYEFDLSYSQDALVESFLAIDVGIDIGLPDEKGNTALHLAKSPRFVEKFIERNPSALNIKNDRAETPFESALNGVISASWADRSAPLGLVQVFLQKGATLPPDESHTLLRRLLKVVVGSHSGKLVDYQLADAVEQLIDRGIDWQSCTLGGDLMREVVDAASATTLDEIEPSALIDLLFSRGVKLDLEGLRDVLLDRIRGVYTSFAATYKLVRLLKQKERGLIQACDPRGEIFWGLMDRIVYYHPYSKRFEEISLMKELLDSGLDLDGNRLVDLLRQILDQSPRYGACRELIQLFQEKRKGLIEKHDPNQTLLDCVRNRIFGDLRLPKPKWAGLLLDLGFKPDAAFLGGFLAIALREKKLPKGIEALCERLIEMQAAQEEGLANTFFVRVVVESMCAQEDLGEAARGRPEDPAKISRSQFHLQVLESLIGKGAGIPDEANGVPLAEALPEEALALIGFRRRGGLTKSARGK